MRYMLQCATMVVTVNGPTEKPLHFECRQVVSWAHNVQSISLNHTLFLSLPPLLN